MKSYLNVGRTYILGNRSREYKSLCSIESACALRGLGKTQGTARGRVPTNVNYTDESTEPSIENSLSSCAFDPGMCHHAIVQNGLYQNHGTPFALNTVAVRLFIC